MPVTYPPRVSHIESSNHLSLRQLSQYKRQIPLPCFTCSSHPCQWNIGLTHVVKRRRNMHTLSQTFTHTKDTWSTHADLHAHFNTYSPWNNNILRQADKHTWPPSICSYKHTQTLTHRHMPGLSYPNITPVHTQTHTQTHTGEAKSPSEARTCGKGSLCTVGANVNWC